MKELNSQDYINEAVERMQMLKMSEDCIQDFVDGGLLQSISGFLYSVPSDILEKVAEFENAYEGKVYHIVYSNTEFGELYTFLYVGKNTDEWEMDREDIKDGYVFSYVYNKTYPEFSELGSVVVTPLWGGLRRVG